MSFFKKLQRCLNFANIQNTNAVSVLYKHFHDVVCLFTPLTVSYSDQQQRHLMESNLVTYVLVAWVSQVIV